VVLGTASCAAVDGELVGAAAAAAAVVVGGGDGEDDDVEDMADDEAVGDNVLEDDGGKVREPCLQEGELVSCDGGEDDADEEEVAAELTGWCCQQ